MFLVPVSTVCISRLPCPCSHSLEGEYEGNDASHWLLAHTSIQLSACLFWPFIFPLISSGLSLQDIFSPVCLARARELHFYSTSVYLFQPSSNLTFIIWHHLWPRYLFRLFCLTTPSLLRFNFYHILISAFRIFLYFFFLPFFSFPPLEVS